MRNPPNLIARLSKALRDGTVTQAEVLLALGSNFTPSPAEAAAIAAAKEAETDDLEIDDLPLCSAADDGVWVSAWVWQSHSDLAAAKAEKLGWAEGGFAAGDGGESKHGWIDSAGNTRDALEVLAYV